MRYVKMILLATMISFKQQTMRTFGSALNLSHNAGVDNSNDMIMMEQNLAC
jgi:hypothetical protein